MLFISPDFSHVECLRNRVVRLHFDTLLFPYCRQIPFFSPLWAGLQVSKPDMISQLEQGTEPWIEESCIPVGSMGGKYCVTTQHCSPPQLPPWREVSLCSCSSTQSITCGEMRFHFTFSSEEASFPIVVKQTSQPALCIPSSHFLLTQNCPLTFCFRVPSLLASNETHAIPRCFHSTLAIIHFLFFVPNQTKNEFHTCSLFFLSPYSLFNSHA